MVTDGFWKLDERLMSTFRPALVGMGRTATDPGLLGGDLDDAVYLQEVGAEVAAEDAGAVEADQVGTGVGAGTGRAFHHQAAGGVVAEHDQLASGATWSCQRGPLMPPFGGQVRMATSSSGVLPARPASG